MITNEKVKSNRLPIVSISGSGQSLWTIVSLWAMSTFAQIDL